MTSFIARAPVRISFGGGGTDLAAYYERFGGFVVSTAISRYCYVVASDSADRSIRINSADYRTWQAFPAGDIPPVEEPLALAKAAVERFAGLGLRDRGVDLFLSSEVPPGTGLGSSSAMAVALIRALAGYLGVSMDPAQVADLACWIEIERLGMPIGKQDQYASSFGGLNAIRFGADGVDVQPLSLGQELLEALSSRLLLFSTGRSRDSATILRGQQNDTESKPRVTTSLHQLKGLAEEMRLSLLRGDLDGFGRLLDEGWRLKKRLSGKVSSPAINRWYAAAREAGAEGGKITGAGGGGFLMLYSRPERQDAVRAAMQGHGLREMMFDFDSQGADVLIATGRDGGWRAAVGNVVSEHVLSRKRLRRQAQREPSVAESRRM